MQLNVRVIPNAKQNKVVEEGNRLKVYLTSSPLEGKANKALIEFLAEHFKVKKSQIMIIRGLKSRDKVLEIRGWVGRVCGSAGEDTAGGSIPLQWRCDKI
ncbi:MAG: DUF167 domain-containing protein [Candidatus Margulisiibacteriota bacterium]